jgi:hypothetical protein
MVVQAGIGSAAGRLKARGAQGTLLGFGRRLLTGAIRRDLLVRSVVHRIWKEVSG